VSGAPNAAVMGGGGAAPPPAAAATQRQAVKTAEAGGAPRKGKPQEKMAQELRSAEGATTAATERSQPSSGGTAAKPPPSPPKKGAEAAKAGRKSPPTAWEAADLEELRPYQLRAALREAGISPMETDGSEAAMRARLRLHAKERGSSRTGSSPTSSPVGRQTAPPPTTNAKASQNAVAEASGKLAETASSPGSRTGKLSAHQQAMQIAAAKDQVQKKQSAAVSASAEYFFAQAVLLHRKFEEIEERSGTSTLSYFDVAQLTGELGRQMPDEELAATLAKLDPQRTGVIHFADFEDWWKGWVQGAGSGGVATKGAREGSSEGAAVTGVGLVSSEGSRPRAGGGRAGGGGGGVVKAGLGGALAMQLAADKLADAAEAERAIATAGSRA
jgi:hypothetical protein